MSSGEPDEIAVLRQHLDEHGVDEEAKRLLARAWPEFTGSAHEAMSSHKLARIEDAEWSAPELTFVVERHGGTVMGSTRADLQRWVVNLDEGTATCARSGFRQVHPASKRLDVRFPAHEIATAIREERDDRRLRWRADRSAVRGLTSQLEGMGSSVIKQTREGRRRRFNHALSDEMSGSGWETGNSGWWHRQPQGPYEVTGPAESK